MVNLSRRFNLLLLLTALNSPACAGRPVAPQSNGVPASPTGAPDAFPAPSATPHPAPEASPLGDVPAATPEPPAFPSPTPLPMGTWQAVIKGTIYDAAAGPDVFVQGATVQYEILHSYVLGIQAGRENRAATDGEGKFLLPVLVHDTDSVRIHITAEGYIPFEERLSGIDLVAGRTYELGLEPVAIAATATP